MKMALKDGRVYIIEADPTQASVIKSWNKMKWNRSRGWLEGDATLELLNKLAGLVPLPGPIEAVRAKGNKRQQVVDDIRAAKNPQPLAKFPVKKSLYQHQLRAADMALVAFGLLDAEAVEKVEKRWTT